METLIKQGLTQLGLDEGKAPLLARYGQLLLEKNQVMNLTAITDPDTVVKMQKLLAALEDNDDVNNVWHSWEMPEEDDED